jgi:hypothetical protein
MAKRQSSEAADPSYLAHLGMEVELQRLEERAAQLRAWLGKLPSRAAAAVRKVAGSAEASSPATRRRRKRTMSAEARRRISEAQKARWAKQKGEAPTPEATPAEATAVVAKAKRGGRGVRKGAAKRGRSRMSAAARRISAPQKKRWAAKRKVA